MSETCPGRAPPTGHRPRSPQTTDHPPQKHQHHLPGPRAGMPITNRSTAQSDSRFGQGSPRVHSHSGAAGGDVDHHRAGTPAPEPAAIAAAVANTAVAPHAAAVSMRRLGGSAAVDMHPRHLPRPSEPPATQQFPPTRPATISGLGVDRPQARIYLTYLSIHLIRGVDPAQSNATVDTPVMYM